MMDLILPTDSLPPRLFLLRSRRILSVGESQLPTILIIFVAIFFCFFQGFETGLYYAREKFPILRSNKCPTGTDDALQTTSLAWSTHCICDVQPIQSADCVGLIPERIPRDIGDIFLV